MTVWYGAGPGCGRTGWRHTGSPIHRPRPHGRAVQITSQDPMSAKDAALQWRGGLSAWFTDEAGWNRPVASSGGQQCPNLAGPANGGSTPTTTSPLSARKRAVASTQSTRRFDLGRSSSRIMVHSFYQPTPAQPHGLTCRLARRGDRLGAAAFGEEPENRVARGFSSGAMPAPDGPMAIDGRPHLKKRAAAPKLPYAGLQWCTPTGARHSGRVPHVKY